LGPDSSAGGPLGPALPASFGRYTLLERVGGGGMATVYRASLSAAGGFEKDVAVKVIRHELSEEPQFTAMFLDEARLSARLNHANIVQTFDFGEADGVHFLAMELVRGRTLAALLRICRAKGIRLGLAPSLHVAAEVAKALGYAHRLSGPGGERLGIVHRDVSPQNVLISREGEVKLADFGIAKAVNRSHVTQPGRVRGKCAYMAPEQVRGEELDGRADVFALGIVLWECLAGRPLFEGDSDAAVLMQVLEKELSPPSSFALEVPPAVDELVLRLLARDKGERPDSTAAARDLADLTLRLIRSQADIDLAELQRRLGSGTAVYGPPAMQPTARVAEPPGGGAVASAGGTASSVEISIESAFGPGAETVEQRSAPLSTPRGDAPEGREGRPGGRAVADPHAETVDRGAGIQAARAESRVEAMESRAGAPAAGADPRAETAEPGPVSPGRASARRTRGRPILIGAASAVVLSAGAGWFLLGGPSGARGADALDPATPAPLGAPLDSRPSDDVDPQAPAEGSRGPRSVGSADPDAADELRSSNRVDPTPALGVASVPLPAQGAARSTGSEPRLAEVADPPASTPARGGTAPAEPTAGPSAKRASSGQVAQGAPLGASPSGPKPLPRNRERIASAAAGGEGNLVLATRLPGRSSVRIDGNRAIELGPSPASLMVAAGRRALRIEREGSAPCSLSIRVDPERKLTLLIEADAVSELDGTTRTPLRCR